jgi:hypothetical protein
MQKVLHQQRTGLSAPARAPRPRRETVATRSPVSTTTPGRTARRAAGTTCAGRLPGREINRAASPLSAARQRMRIAGLRLAWRPTSPRQHRLAGRAIARDRHAPEPVRGSTDHFDLPAVGIARFGRNLPSTGRTWPATRRQSPHLTSSVGLCCHPESRTQLRLADCSGAMPRKQCFCLENRACFARGVSKNGTTPPRFPSPARHIPVGGENSSTLRIGRSRRHVRAEDLPLLCNESAARQRPLSGDLTTKGCDRGRRNIGRPRFR